MIFIPDNDYILTIEKTLSELPSPSKTGVMTLNNIDRENQQKQPSKSLVYRQLFYDFLFSSNFELPTFKSMDVIIKVLSYFQLRIKALKEKNIITIININDFYGKISKNIFLLITSGNYKEEDINNLQHLFYDLKFFTVFVKNFVENPNYYNSILLALSNVLKNAFEEKEELLYAFKNGFIEELFSQYNLSDQLDLKESENLFTIKNIEDFLKHYLLTFEDKNDIFSFREIRKYIIDFFLGFGIDVLSGKKIHFLKEKKQPKAVEKSPSIEQQKTIQLKEELEEDPKIIGKKRERKRNTSEVQETTKSNNSEVTLRRSARIRQKKENAEKLLSISKVSTNLSSSKKDENPIKEKKNPKKTH